MKHKESTIVISRIVASTAKLAGWSVAWIALGLLVAVLGNTLIPVTG